jgi:hypothetical protein
MNNPSTANGTSSALRAILLKLAKQQDDLAAQEAATVPYWTPCPPSVLGHRAAAETLRAQADEYLTAVIGVAS